MSEEPKSKITMRDLRGPDPAPIITENRRITIEDIRLASMKAVEKAKKIVEGKKPDQFDLLDLYVDQQLDLRDIAAKFRVSKDTVRVWLIAAEVPLRARGVRGGGHSGVTKRLFTASDRLTARHVTFKVSILGLPPIVQVRIVALKKWAADLVEDAVLARKALDEADLLERSLTELDDAKREIDAFNASFGSAVNR